ncbi:MAG: bifunctional hydroxymethylpyrimidine kinase/phosphomethylpyrimidine kinase [Bacillota bacterium]|nr:bifunctional hydroxymethylpyrimidine kinase/phosphomethylpyrimidine kinase [Bacillota bacterium]
MYKVLTIAGSDSSGGAGIQADLKTMSAHGVYGMSAITALTAQNTMGVKDILESTPEFLAQQLDCIFTDIYPDAVKIGMVANSGLIEVIAAKLKEYGAKNIVVDPVMIATSGSSLMETAAAGTLKDVLIPAADIITPNLSEAQALSGVEIEDAEGMILAAAAISQYYNGYVLVKGGHSNDNADDLLYRQGQAHWLRGERIDNPNTHGTGCTLSSAIACELATGKDMVEAVAAAKAYISAAIGAKLDLGQGRGPLNHNVTW